MKPETVLKVMSLFSPTERKIIDLVTNGAKPGRIAKELHITKEAARRYVEQIAGFLREVSCNV